jgi:hypothetical protein
MTQPQKQNVTVSLSMQTIRKAKLLAEQRSTSISQLLAEQIESLMSEHDAYEQAAASAIARMERGLHLGGQRIVRGLEPSGPTGVLRQRNAQDRQAAEQTFRKSDCGGLSHLVH